MNVLPIAPAAALISPIFGPPLIFIFYFLCKLANAQSWVSVVITLPQYSHLPDDVILVGAPQFGQLVVSTSPVAFVVFTPVVRTKVNRYVLVYSVVLSPCSTFPVFLSIM